VLYSCRPEKSGFHQCGRLRGNKTGTKAVWQNGEVRAEGTRLHDVEERARFERILLPHLSAAYNLARWLTGNDHDAEDAVQESYLRAVKFFGGFHGSDGRGWLLAIVRNACYSQLERKKAQGAVAAFDEQVHAVTADAGPVHDLQRQESRQTALRAVEALPVEMREVVVLRELEGLSYKEIAAVAGIPIGTVMSRLARGRERLQQLLGAPGMPAEEP
jgi:RNA polymerase sigma-70 factor (ECF subfamily)